MSRWWVRAFELVGVWSVAVAYPMIQAATSGPDAFTMASIDGLDVLLFLAALILPVPLIATGLELLLGLRSTQAADWFHGAFIALMVSIFSWQVVQSVSQSPALRHFIPLFAFALILWAYLNLEAPRQVVGLLAFAPVLIVAITLISDPARSTVLPTWDEPAKTQTTNDPPIMMIVLDELPLVALLDEEGRIDRDLFPGFAALADQSTWYSNARANADYTVRALPSILTGQSPPTEDVPPTRRNYPENLFTTLRSAGYEVDGSESRTSLCPASACVDRGSRLGRLSMLLENSATYSTVLPDDLEDTFVSHLTRRLPTIERDQVARLKNFMETAQLESSRFEFLHVELPHIPWQLLPDGRRHNAPFFAGIVKLEGSTTDETWDSPIADQAMQRMMMQLSYVDGYLESFLTRLQRSAEWEEAMLVVLADHGAAFEQGIGRRRIAQENAGWQIPVPLFVKYPGETDARVDSRPVGLENVAPTILQELGLDLPAGAVGASLREEDSGAPRKYVAENGEEIDIYERDVTGTFRRALDRRNSLFEGGSLYALAGYSSLLGRSVEDLRLTELDVDVDPTGHLDDMKFSDDEIPSYWNGSISDGVKPTSGRVAVAVNGRVVTTVPAWEDAGASGTWIVQAILPPESLREGKNEVVAYALP